MQLLHIIKKAIFIGQSIDAYLVAMVTALYFGISFLSNSYPQNTMMDGCCVAIMFSSNATDVYVGKLVIPLIDMRVVALTCWQNA